MTNPRRFDPQQPHRNRPDGRQAEQLITELIDNLTTLRDGLEPTKERPIRLLPVSHIFELANSRIGDGWARSVRPSNGTSTVTDDLGQPMPPLSDPVGEQAATNADGNDGVRRHADTILRGLNGALGDIRMAVGAASHITPPKQDPTPDEPECTNHANAGLHNEPTRSGDRCRWCYDFWLAQGVDAPAELLIARYQGKRITPGLVTEALAPSRKPKARVR